MQGTFSQVPQAQASSSLPPPHDPYGRIGPLSHSYGQDMPDSYDAGSSFCLIRGETSQDIESPPTIAEYIDRCPTYFDASRLRLIPEGGGDICRNHERVMARWGACMKRWIHWSAEPANLPTTGRCDLPWARTPCEQECQERTELHARHIDRDELRFYDHGDVNTPLLYS